MAICADVMKYYAKVPSLAVEAVPQGIQSFRDHMPGARAIKVFDVLLAHAGSGGATDEEHELSLAAIKSIKGLGNLARLEIVPALDELRRTGVPEMSEDGRTVTVASLIERYRIIEREGGVAIAWRFGSTYIRLAQTTDRFAKVDLASLAMLRGRYAVHLYRFLSGKFGQNKSYQELKVQEFRAVASVDPGKYAKFRDLRKFVIDPAVKELSAKTRYIVMVHYNRKGRNVESMTFSWELKIGLARERAEREPQNHSSGRAQRLAGFDERPVDDGSRPDPSLQFGWAPFPKSMAAFKNTYWEDAFRAAGCKSDPMEVLRAFRPWAEKKKAPISPRAFYSFAHRYARNRNQVQD